MDSEPRATPLIGFIAAESLSLLGNQIAAVAIPLLILQFTQSPLTTGIASAANVLPVFLAAVVGGRAIDRFGAWTMSLAADLLSFCSVLALPLAFLYFKELPVISIFVLVLAGALFDPTGISARQTLVPGLVKLSGKSLVTVNSLRGGLENGADFLGPVIGVLFIGLVGALNTLYINAMTFLLCAVIFTVSVPVKRQSQLSPSEGAGLSGVSYIFSHPQLKALAIIGMLANCAILPFLSLLLPVLTTQKFASPTLLGICLSVFGLAATLGASAFSWLSKNFPRSLIYYGGLFLTGAAILLTAVATYRYQVVLCAAFAGLLLGAGNPLQQTLQQEETPEAIAGQVFTALTAIHFAAGPLGLLAAGMLAEVSGVEKAFLMAGGLLIALAGFGWFFLPLQTSPPNSPDRN
jgi:MFS family permease